MAHSSSQRLVSAMACVWIASFYSPSVFTKLTWQTVTIFLLKIHYVLFYRFGPVCECAACCLFTGAFGRFSFFEPFLPEPLLFYVRENIIIRNQFILSEKSMTHIIIRKIITWSHTHTHTSHSAQWKVGRYSHRMSCTKRKQWINFGSWMLFPLIPMVIRLQRRYSCIRGSQYLHWEIGSLHSRTANETVPETLTDRPTRRKKYVNKVRRKFETKKRVIARFRFEIWTDAKSEKWRDGGNFVAA